MISFSLFFSHRAAVTIPAAILAPHRTRDMRLSGIRLNVFHNMKMDGKERAGGFKRYWKYTNFTEAQRCPVRNAE
jgi:hypothetical protein